MPTPNPISSSSARVQLADCHLTYIEADPPATHRRIAHTWYDVYPHDGGHQLGWVYRSYGLWTAVSDDPTVQNASAPTRWEAATALWGHSRD